MQCMQEGYDVYVHERGMEVMMAAQAWPGGYEPTTVKGFQ